MTLPDFIYVDNTEQFRWLAVELADEELIAIDTESNSMHAYRGEICLIQLSTRNRDFIVDPLAIDDLSPLGVLMEDERIEILFHAAEYDLMLFKRDYGFVVNNLFDTMVAARVAGYQYHGLANMLRHFFDIDVDKSHQKDNWGIRPLPKDSLKYAQMDTHMLPALRDILEDELIKMGRWEEAIELFKEAEKVPSAEEVYDPEGYWKIGMPSRLRRDEMAVLRELYLLREDIAQAEDVPVHRIFSNQVLIKMARKPPQSASQLFSVRGLSGAQARRYSDDILDAIERGQKATLPPPPPAPRPPAPEIVARYTALQQWRKYKGQERGVESDVVLTKDIMWRLAKDVPQSIEELEQIHGFGTTPD